MARSNRYDCQCRLDRLIRSASANHGIQTQGGEINVTRYSPSAAFWFENLGIVIVAYSTTAGMSTCGISS